MNPNHRELNIYAGTLAAFRWGTFGVILTGLIIGAISINRWHELLDHGQYVEWCYWYIVMASWPVLACGAVLASAGWLAFARKPTWSIAESVAFVGIGSIVLWALLVAILPRRSDAKSHPLMHPSDILVVTIPPMLISAVVTKLRSRNCQRDSHTID